MKATDRSHFPRRATILGLALIALCASSFAQDSLQQYTQTNLVSNQSGVTTNPPDTDFVNAWGLSRSSGSPWWVSDNQTGLSTLYNGSGVKQGLVVTVPPANPALNPTGSPTGTIYNGSALDFLLPPGKPAVFLFCTLDGTISGWNPGVNPSAAVIMVNQTGKSVFTGMAVAQVTQNGASTTYLYAADFGQGRVQVYDTSFNPVTMPGDGFRDFDFHAGYAPFNIWNIGGNLYVAFAPQDPSNMSYDADSRGLGFLDVFSPSGRLLQRLERGPWFNSPWGLAQAPSDFGLFSHDILVGQFGSGQILAFDPVTGRYKGKLLDNTNSPITIDGLWALSFGNDGNAGPAKTLYFSAGPNNGSSGLLGTITPVQNIEGNDQ